MRDKGEGGSSLDETNLDVLIPRQLDEIDQLVFVEVLHNDHVQLGCQAFRLERQGCVERLHHGRVAGATGDELKLGGMQCVETLGLREQRIGRRVRIETRGGLGYQRIDSAM